MDAKRLLWAGRYRRYHQHGSTDEILRVEHEGWGEVGCVLQGLSDARAFVDVASLAEVMVEAEAKARGRDSRAHHQHRQTFVPCNMNY